MKHIRLLFRLCGIVLIVLWGIIQAALFFDREGRNGRRRRIQVWSRQCLRLFGIHLYVEGAERFFAEGGQFMVGNHVSWLDIFVVNSVCSVRFVAKEEVRKWPGIGWLAARADTVFIKRGSRSSSERVREVLIGILAEGDCAVVYPEGTSTDGSKIKPFKINMFETSIQSRQAVWPLLVYYPDAHGRPDSKLAYYGDISLWQSFRTILPEKKHRAELYFLDPINPENKNRAEIALEAQNAVATKLAQLSGKNPADVVSAEAAFFAKTD